MSEPMVSHDAVAFYLLSEEVAARQGRAVRPGRRRGLRRLPLVPAAAPTRRGAASTPTRGRSSTATTPSSRRCSRRARRRGDDSSRDFVAEHFARAGAGDGAGPRAAPRHQVMLVDDPVKRVDNMTMAWGLEARTPFLDHELVELAAACPPELKLAHGGKGVLKDAARGLVPDAVIDRPEGLLPRARAVAARGPDLELVADALTAPAARERGLFAPTHVDALLAAPNEHRTTLGGPSCGSWRCWSSGSSAMASEFYDEAFAAPGEPRAHYSAVLGRLGRDRPGARPRRRPSRRPGRRGAGARPVRDRPVPRLLPPGSGTRSPPGSPSASARSRPRRRRLRRAADRRDGHRARRRSRRRRGLRAAISGCVPAGAP